MAALSHESAALPARRQTRSAARLTREGLAEAGLIALLLFAPLPLGSVHPGAILVMTVWIAVLGWLVLPWRACGAAAATDGGSAGTRFDGSRSWGWMCAGLLSVAGAQVLPL